MNPRYLTHNSNQTNGGVRGALRQAEATLSRLLSSLSPRPAQTNPKLK